MRISALLINHNSGGTILRSIRSLMDQNHRVDNIIVIDNGSTDGSPAQIRRAFPTVNLIELGENRGLSAARNIGLNHATGNMVLMVDDDVYLSENALQLMLQAHLETGALVTCPRIILLPETHILQCDGAEVHFTGTLSLRHAYQEVTGHRAKREMTGGFIGACMLVDRKKLIEAGSFDESYFFYFEDLELSYRLRARGHAICCEEAAVAFHEQGQGTENLSFRGKGAYPSKRAYLNLRNRWQTVWIHYQVRTLLLLAPALMVYEFAVLVESARRGWLQEYARAMISLAHELHSIYMRRKRYQIQRTVPDRLILTGGDLPLARGFMEDRHRKLLHWLNRLLNRYWNWIRTWL